MPIRVACPSCEAVINAPDSAAGRTVKCPKCKEAMVLPGGDDDVMEADDFEVVDEPAPKKKAPPPVDDDDDRAKSRYGKNKRRDDDDYEDDRPRRAPRDDDYEEDDRPARKKGKALPMPALIGGGAVLLLLLLLGGLWAGGVFSGGGDNKHLIGSGKAKGRVPPAGWSVADAENFSCFMPGQCSRVNFNNNSAARNTQHGGGQYESWASHGEKVDYTADSLTYDTFKPGNTDEQLFTELKALLTGTASPDSNTHTITSRKMITVNGQPCLEIRWKFNQNWQAEFHAKNNSRRPAGANVPEMPAIPPSTNVEDYAARVMVIGNKVFVLYVGSRGSTLKEDDVKAFFDSFQTQ